MNHDATEFLLKMSGFLAHMAARFTGEEDRQETMHAAEFDLPSGRRLVIQASIKKPD